MSDEPIEHKPQSKAGCAIAILFLLPLIYVFSPAPVFFILEHAPSGVQETAMPVLSIVFAPLEWCYNHIPWVENFYDWQFALVGIISR